MSQIRPTAVAGAFYPGNGQVLSRDLDTLLASAQQAHGPLPKALIPGRSPPAPIGAWRLAEDKSRASCC
jgi:predicted class III extradiol MEMO1 family dioxygenase